MKTRTFGLALGVLLLLPALLGAGELRRAAYPVAGRYIVVLEPDVARLAGGSAWKPSVEAVAQDMAVIYGAAVDRRFEHALAGFSARLSAGALERMLRDPRIQYIEEDGLVWATATQSNATWGLDRIDQRSLPLSTTYTYDTTAANVNAYIIDTGILATHQNFGGRVLGGFTAISDGRGTSDCNGHGTHVAGTVGSATWGVAKAVRLVPVRVLNCQGSGTNSGVIAGVDWVTANHVKPAVANMSLGGGISSALDSAVTNSINAGVTYALAAGNDNTNACNTSPARTPAAITVGSSTNTDARSSFSNIGTCVDIFAPGSSITSTWSTSNTATNTISGTSMASPHVAGVAALYLAANPGATPAQVGNAIINGASVDKLTGIGTGSPNRLLYSLLGGTPPPTDSPPTAAFTFSCSGLACSFDGNGSSDDVGIDSYAWSFGDSTPDGSGVTASHTYAAAGTYTVVLTVTDTGDQIDTETKSVTVNSSTAPCSDCELYSGTLSSGGSATFPTSQGWNAPAGTHRGYLRGPANADFDLSLQYRYAGIFWITVASSTGTTSSEDIVYTTTTAGRYRWRVNSYSGSGTFQLWIKRP